MKLGTHALFLGRPGCGKDTHGGKQAAAFKTKHVIMSTQLRSYLTHLGTPEALEELDVMNGKGAVARLVKPQFTKPAFVETALSMREENAIWNGFPRNVTQLVEMGLFIDDFTTVVFDITRKEAMGRIQRRAEEDRAAGKPVRADDLDENKRNQRQDEFERDTLPVISELRRAKNNIIVVDGMGSKEETAAQVTEAMENIMGKTKVRVEDLLVSV